MEQEPAHDPICYSCSGESGDGIEDENYKLKNLPPEQYYQHVFLLWKIAYSKARGAAQILGLL